MWWHHFCGAQWHKVNVKRGHPCPGCGQEPPSCSHGNREGDCPSCAACTACRGECGVCPYV